MLLLHRLGLASAVAAGVAAGSMTQVAAAVIGLATPLAAEELLVQIHWDPAKGSHKQCLYGIYGSKGQHKGYHRHLSTYDRGQPCAPFLNPGAKLPAKLSKSGPPIRIRSPRAR